MVLDSLSFKRPLHLLQTHQSHGEHDVIQFMISFTVLKKLKSHFHDIYIYNLSIYLPAAWLCCFYPPFFALHCKFGDAHWPVCIGVQMTLAAPYYPQPLDILIDISLSALVLKATTFHFISFSLCAD